MRWGRRGAPQEGQAAVAAVGRLWVWPPRRAPILLFDFLLFGTAILPILRVRALPATLPVFIPTEANPTHPIACRPKGEHRRRAHCSDSHRTGGRGPHNPMYTGETRADSAGSPLGDPASHPPFPRLPKCRKRVEKRNRTPLSRKIPHILHRPISGLPGRFR